MKEEIEYSTYCKKVKTKANITVSHIPCKDPALLPWITEWWAYVTVNPDESNKNVFKRGSSKGLTESIPSGGQWDPISVGGDNALWKKAQNMLRKNNASLTMNKATPIFKPLCTAKVWLPKYVPSHIISLNQNDIENINNNKAKINSIPIKENPCIVKTPEQVSVKRERQVNIGHTDGETRWKGCAWKLLLIKLVIICI